MRRSTWYIIATLAIIFSLVIGWLQFYKFQNFGYNGLDLGIYAQTTWSLAHGHGFASSIHDPNYLGDHLELWLVPLSWLYRLWSSPVLLLWIQTLVMAAAVFPLAWLARRLLNDRAAIIVTVLYLLHPFVYNVALYEFHGLVFVLPLALWSIVAYERRKYRQWLLALGLILTVREDMPLLVLGWGLLALFDRRGWRWWLPAGIAGIAWFVGAQAIIRHASFLGQYKYLAFYGWLGQTPRAMAVFPFRHPLLFLSHIFSLNNWQTVLAALAMFGFLPALQVKKLWPVSLLFVQLMLIGSPASSVLHIHYVLPYIPFLLWATLTVLADLSAGKVWPQFDQSLLRPVLVILAIVGPLYGQFVYGPAEWPWTKTRDPGQTPPAILRAAANLVHPADKVLTTFNLIPTMANRVGLYSLNYVYLGRRQYTEVPYVVPGKIDVALIDWQQLYVYQFLYLTTEFHGKNGAERIAELLDKNNLQLAWWHDSVAIYTRFGHNPYQPTVKINDSVFQSLLKVGSLEYGANILDQPILFSLDRNQFIELPLSIFWRVEQTPSTPVSIRFVLRRANQPVWISTRLLGQGTNPATTWLPGEIWQTKYALDIPATLRGDFTLQAEIVELTGQYRLNRWRTFTPVITKEKKLGTIDFGLVRL